MKTVIAGVSICMMLLWGVPTHAGSVWVLPEPSIKTISGTFCAPYTTPNDSTTPWTHQAVTGISLDGKTVTAVAEGTYPCRGAIPYCVQLTWTLNRDSNGALVLPLPVATFTKLAPCPSWAQIFAWQALQFYDEWGYEAYTSVQNNCSVYGCYAYNIATLATQ